MMAWQARTENCLFSEMSRYLPGASHLREGLEFSARPRLLRSYRGWFGQVRSLRNQPPCKRVALVIWWMSAGLAILSAALAVWLGFGIPAILIGLFAIAVWLAGRAFFVILAGR
jgi:hypothetical protein